MLVAIGLGIIGLILIYFEFFVPGECQTIWNNDAKACTWIPTDRNFLGTAPTREIPKHVHGEKINI